MDLDQGKSQGNLLSQEDILAHIEVDSETKCAHWQGKSHKNKPILYKKGRVVYVRSEVYKLRKGPIPRGFYVYMTCKNWDCVNSRHMDLRPVGRPFVDLDQA